MPIPDAILPQPDDSNPLLEADVNNVIAIQNDWISALLACEISNKTYQDCAVCKNNRCMYAWAKLQTLWPEIGNWPPRPVKEVRKNGQNGLQLPSHAKKNETELPICNSALVQPTLQMY